MHKSLDVFLKTMLLIFLSEYGNSLFKHFAINDFTCWDSSLWGNKMPATVRSPQGRLKAITTKSHGSSSWYFFSKRKWLTFQHVNIFSPQFSNLSVVLSSCSALSNFLLLSAGFVLPINTLSVRYTSHVCSMSRLRGSKLARLCPRQSVHSLRSVGLCARSCAAVFQCITSRLEAQTFLKTHTQVWRQLSDFKSLTGWFYITTLNWLRIRLEVKPQFFQGMLWIGCFCLAWNMSKNWVKVKLWMPADNWNTSSYGSQPSTSVRNLCI